MGLFFREKHQYIRSGKLLRIVSNMPCQSCYKYGETQAAHTNWGHGKGRGIKADDNYVAALCQTCHYLIDQGATMTKKERQEMWHRAFVRTMEKIRKDGQWPIGVPFPDLDRW